MVLNELLNLLISPEGGEVLMDNLWNYSSNYVSQ